MQTLIIDNAKALIEYGVLGVLVLLFVSVTIIAGWAFVKEFVPTMKRWMESHAKFADVAREELPKIREVVEGSTEAVKRCTEVCLETSKMASKALENTVIVGSEQRDFRDGTVKRDERIEKKLDTIVDIVSEKENK